MELKAHYMPPCGIWLDKYLIVFQIQRATMTTARGSRARGGIVRRRSSSPIFEVGSRNRRWSLPVGRRHFAGTRGRRMSAPSRNLQPNGRRNMSWVERLLLRHNLRRSGTHWSREHGVVTLLTAGSSRDGTERETGLTWQSGSNNNRGRRIGQTSRPADHR